MNSFFIRSIAVILALVVFPFRASRAAAPVYAGSSMCVINNDVPEIDELYTGESYIHYEPLDKWQRSKMAAACLGPETMAASGRSSMQGILPPGWQSDTYEFISGKSLFHRCHLVGDQLGGAEIAENLITGTQYLNIAGMLPIENLIAEYIRTTGHHVLYRVWPYYGAGNYVCFGVQIEAKSVEDDRIRLNRYCFNVQPGIGIDYRTGLNRLAGTSAEIEYTEPAEADLSVTVRSDQLTFVLNTNTMRFHKPDCASCAEMLPKNRQETTLTRDRLIEMGYRPCGKCDP